MGKEILEIGNPLLRTPSKPLPEELIQSSMVQQLIKELIGTMREANGAGLAAPQIGESVRLFAVEVKDNPRYPYKPEIPLTVVINPEITFLTEERYASYEGCLSVPGIRGVVKRCPYISVHGFREDGTVFQREIRGISAGTFQHELDHLNGTLFVDHVTDSRTFCSWKSFKTWHETDFRRTVRDVEKKWNP